MAFELFDLSARISIDAKGVDSTLVSTQRKAKDLEGEFKKLDSSIKNVGKSGSLHSQLSASLGLDKLKSDMVALREKAAATSAASAEMGESFLASAGSLATFAVGAVAVGAALLKLEKGMLDLSLSTAATEAGIANLAKRYRVSTDQLQAAQILAAKSGKSLNEVLQETSRIDLQNQVDDFQRLGLIIGRDAVGAGKRLNDEVITLGQRLQVLDAQIAGAITPHTLKMVDSYSDTLKRNRGAVTELSVAVGGFASFMQTHFVASLAVAESAIKSFRFAISPVIAVLEFVEGLKGQTGTIPRQSTQFGVGGDAGVGAGIFRAKAPRTTGGSSRTGKTDEERALEAAEKRRQDYYQKLQEDLKRVVDQIKGVDTATREYATQQEILNGILRAASPAFQDLNLAVAHGFDNKTKQLALQNELHGFMKEQEQDVRAAIDGEKGLITQTAEFISSLEKQGAVLGDATKIWVMHNAQILSSVEALKMYQRTLEAVMVAGVAGPGIGEDAIARAAGIAADNAAGAPPPLLRDYQDQIRRLAANLTYSIDSGLREGFENGMSAGVKAFERGILEMLRSAALAALEKKLTDMFTKLFKIKSSTDDDEDSGDGGGGGITGLLSGIAKALFGGGGGGGGGWSGALGGSHGGIVPGVDRGYDSVRTMLRPGERVLTREQQQQSGVIHYSPTIIVNVQTLQDAGSRTTAYQAAKAMNAHLSKAMLMG